MFSIIMPAYNAAEFIEESINSVLNQTFGDFELIVIDDGSSDQTKNIIQKYQKNDLRIKLLSNPNNMGVAQSRNIGINIAKFPYICFLDSDDLWTPDKLSEYNDAFSKGSIVLYSYYTRFTHGKTLNLVKAPAHITFSELLKGNCIGNLTGAYNSMKIGKFFQKKIRHEDYLMWLEILKVAKSADCIQKNLASYRVLNSSLSGNKFKSLYWTWNIYRVGLKINPIASLYYTINYIYRAILKRN